MKHLSKFFIILSVLFSMALSTSLAQQNEMFSPPNGPIGTNIFIDCGPNGTTARFANQDITLDANGFGSFQVPTAYAQGNYRVTCRSANNVETILGNFTVTECPILDERTLTDFRVAMDNTFSAQGGADIQSGENVSITGENLGVVGRNTYRYIVDINNERGAQLRLIIRSNDPTRLVNYVNNMRFDFDVYSPSSGENFNNCGTDIQMPFGSNQILSRERGEVDVEMVLLSGESIQAESSYLVYFVVSSTLDANFRHTYQPENSTAIGVRLQSYSDFVSLSAWNNNNSQGYSDTVEAYNRNVAVPGLVAVSDGTQTDFRVSVNNLTTTLSDYRMAGTFQINACNGFGNDCLGSQIERSAVLARGIGGSSGNAVYNGNFEIEYFCQQLVPGSTVSHDDVNWYCNRDGQRTQLNEGHFTEICRQTYSNREAFAVRDLDLTTPDDSANRIPAFNWRCLGPVRES